MRPIEALRALAFAALALALAACTSSMPAPTLAGTGTTTAPGGTSPATPAGGATATAVGTVVVDPSVAPTSDPGTGPAEPGTDTSVACALITQQEAAAATGVTVERLLGNVVGPTASCLYFGAADAMVLSSVRQTPATGLDAYLNDPANEQIPGVGDKAVIFRATGSGLPTGRTIYVRKGDVGLVLNVHVEGIDDARAKTVLVQLATTAAGRM